jgi:hypothetical protein
VMHPLPRNQEISDEVDFDQVHFLLRIFLIWLESGVFPTDEIRSICEDGVTRCSNGAVSGSYLVAFRSRNLIKKKIRVGNLSIIITILDFWLGFVR